MNTFNFLEDGFPMTLKTVAYLLYLAITVPLTIYVARTLFRNGRVFLHDVFNGNDGLADAVNRLLVVGFYLFNLGYVALFMQNDETIENTEQLMEVLSVRVGLVAMVLGVVHLVNVWVFNRIRRHAAIERQWAPPVAGCVHTGEPMILETVGAAPHTPSPPGVLVHARWAPLTVLYDEACPVCRRARRWVEGQLTYAPVVFVAAGSEEARRRFPVLDHAATRRRSPSSLTTARRTAVRRHGR